MSRGDPDDRDDDREDRRRRRDEFDEDDREFDRRAYRARDERVRRGRLLVRIPGVLMILVSLLGIGNMGWALADLDGQVDGQDELKQQLLRTPPMTPAERERQKTINATIATVGVIGAVLGLVGGICMVAVAGRGLAVASAVVAVVPLLHGCCFLSTCVGVYALFMLLNKDVKLAFADRTEGPRDEEGDRRDGDDDRR